MRLPSPKAQKSERAIRAERKIPDDKECVDRRGSNDGEENNSNDVIGHDQAADVCSNVEAGLELVPESQEKEFDPAAHSEYDEENIQYLKGREQEFRVPDYMESQHHIDEAMRRILVDWLVQVQIACELNHETLYTAVKMVDMYLAKEQVKREDLQLIGAVACLVASKVEESYPPTIANLLITCDLAYTRQVFKAAERNLLAVVGFQAGIPLTYTYLRHFGQECHVSMPLLLLARYILELSLMEYHLSVDVNCIRGCCGSSCFGLNNQEG